MFLLCQAFSVVFQKAVLKAEADEDLKQRVSNLIESITSSIFQYTTRGLFECDKLMYIAQLTFQVPPWNTCVLCVAPLVLRKCEKCVRKKKEALPAASALFWSSSGLLCLQILMMNNDINPAELDFLLRYPVQPGVTSPVDFLSNHSWGGIKVPNKATSNFVALRCKAVWQDCFFVCLWLRFTFFVASEDQIYIYIYI